MKHNIHPKVFGRTKDLVCKLYMQSVSIFSQFSNVLSTYITWYLRANFCLFLPSYIGQWTYVKNLGGGGDVVSNNRNNSQVKNFGFHVTREVHLHCNQKRMIAIIQLETPRTDGALCNTVNYSRVPKKGPSPHLFFFEKSLQLSALIRTPPPPLLIRFLLYDSNL